MSTLKVNSLTKVDGSFLGGRVVQVVHGQNAGKTYVGSNGFVLVRTCPVTITPTNSSNIILVSVYTRVGRSGNNGNARFKLYRTIGGTTSDLTKNGGTATGENRCWFSHWNDYNSYTADSVGKTHVDDTHSTTSAITYKLYCDTEASGTHGTIGGRPNDTFHNCGTDWTLMEIAV